MAITLSAEELAQTLERAYLLAISSQPLPPVWITRSEQLSQSPSVGFVAAIGAVLLAKATDDSIDAFAIQAREGGAGAFNLRAAATALAARRRALGYDIGSTSDRDPINHGTLVSSKRWDVALNRIRHDHKPFFELILTWLQDVNRMDRTEAVEALAAYLRVRRAVAPGAAVNTVPSALSRAPNLSDLIDVIDGFVGAESEGGSRGMALVGAAYRTAGFEVVLPSRNDPRRIDIAIKRNDMLVIGSEVKQLHTEEVTATTLVQDVVEAGCSRALLAVLPPGTVGFDKTRAIREAEEEYGVILRVTSGARQLFHEALSAAPVEIEMFCSAFPRAFAVALRDMRASDTTIETWAAIASRWQ